MPTEKKFPRNPFDVLLYGISFIQKWEMLLKGGNQDKLQQLRKKELEWRCNFQSSIASVSDIIEL